MLALFGHPEGDAADSYRPRKRSADDRAQGTEEPILAALSLRLGLGPAFHPKLTPNKGLAVDARFGAVFMIPPLLAVWPELGGSFEVSQGFERAMGTVDLNIGLPAFLYYGVGFVAGVDQARLLGFRHGLDLRFFQVDHRRQREPAAARLAGARPEPPADPAAESRRPVPRPHRPFAARVSEPGSC